MIHGYSPNSIAYFSKSDLRGNGWKSSGCRNKVRAEVEVLAALMGLAPRPSKLEAANEDRLVVSTALRVEIVIRQQCHLNLVGDQPN